MRIVSVGIGYIGLPLTCLFARTGLNCIGLTRDSKKAKQLNAGIPTFHEPGLDVLLNKVLSMQTFYVDTNLDEIKNADAIFICVPTPLTPERRMDDTAVLDATKKIGKQLQINQLVVVESTISPGTTQTLVKNILEEESGLQAGSQFFLAHCPERAIPGNSLHEMQFNDRIIGGIDKESTNRAQKLYKTISKGKIITTDSTTAEVVKLVENASRDVQIAFANEIALVCEQLGINVFDVIRYANHHPRVSILQPGTGVGGHCLPIDPWFLIERFSDAQIIPAARAVNDYMPEHTFNLASRKLQAHRVLSDSKIVILGLAYKADVDDTRESPSRTISHYFQETGAEIIGYDPLVTDCDFIQTSDSLESAVKEADCLIIVVNHKEFNSINWEKIRKVMRTPIILDGSNLFERPPRGYEYIGLGKADRTSF